MFSCPLRDGAEIRLLELRHAEELFAAVERNRAHIERWLEWPSRTTSVDDVKAFLQMALAQFAAGDGFQAGIWLDGRISGGIGLHKINWLDRNVEIGYWLDAGAQGRGIVTEACHAVLNYCFREIKLHRVGIRCAVENTKSCAIAERLGFTREGVLRQAQGLHGAFVDNALYSILASEWKTAP